VRGAAGWLAYPLLVLGAAAVFTATHRIWTGSFVLGAPTWRPWLALAAGSAALCVAVVLL
jgi:hypothetical protein